jgi:hypothetical protein
MMSKKGGFYMRGGKCFYAPLIFFAVCASSEAQITFGAWGRAVITPLAFTGEHSAVSAATYTSSDTPVIGFTANGTPPSGKIGFKIDLAFGGGQAGVGDNAKVWVKPFEAFTLTAGVFKEEELRGKIGASEFAAWILPNAGKGEDAIFQRFDAFAGAHFKLEPLKALIPDSPFNSLTIQGAFGSNSLGMPVNNTRAILNLFNYEDYNEEGKVYDGDDRKMSAADVYKAMHIAVGYRIPDIGLFRVQFIGNNRNVYRWLESGGALIDRGKPLATGMNTNGDADIIQAAFLFDGVPGVTVDFGVKMPFVYTTNDSAVSIYPRTVGSDGHPYLAISNVNKKDVTIQRPYTLALGALWDPDFLTDLTLAARFDVSFGEKIDSSDGYKVTSGFAFSAWLMPSYTFGAVKAGIDAGIEAHGKDSLWATSIKSDDIVAMIEPSQYFDFGACAWIELNFGDGKIRAGFAMMAPGVPRYAYDESAQVNKNLIRFKAEPVFSIPISFTYSF